MAAAVSVKALTKRFGKLTALKEVSFEVPNGSLFGLLGPNGAGKTTLFSVAAGFLKPTRGTVEVLGIDVSRISELRGRFSMLPQDAAFQGGIPIAEQFVMFARLNGRTKAQALTESQVALEKVGLGEVARRSARSLSHGMRKRVALAQAFLGDAEVIFLDEPTSGLDPENARRMRELIRSMREHRTVVISSHNLREIQDLCDHVAILDKGTLLEWGSMEALTAGSTLIRISLERELSEPAERALLAIPEVSEVEKTSGTEFNVRLDLEGRERSEAMKHIYTALAEQGIFPRSVFEGESLETRFLEITGGSYDGASAT